LKGQYFYCILITTGLHSITHGTAWFVAFVPQALGFSWIVFRWAEIKRDPRARLAEGVRKIDASPFSLRNSTTADAIGTDISPNARKP
jgi:hypothetical protein